MKRQNNKWYANIQGVWYEADNCHEAYLLIQFYNALTSDSVSQSVSQSAKESE